MSDFCEKENNIVVCRCEEKLMGEIREWIAKGYDTFEEIRRALRVGMGPCQGRGCQEIIMREIAKFNGCSIADMPTGTVRPPVKPIKLGLLAAGGDE